MSARTILTLANGKGTDLLDPQHHEMDFIAIAEQLAKEARFNGATPGVVYSVAEHCARGCDAILKDVGNETAAAYFLLHDGHEALLKDDTAPKKQALAEVAQERFGVLAEHIISAWKLLEYRADAAIHQAAGLDWPRPLPIDLIVKRYDMIMFVTEWRDLMGNVEHPNWTPYEKIEPLIETISPWAAATAMNGFLRRCWSLLPALQRFDAEAARCGSMGVM